MRTMWWVGYCGLNHELGGAEIENIDISSYCAGYVERAYIILFAMVCPRLLALHQTFFPAVFVLIIVAFPRPLLVHV
jgi:hypothetical protein